MPTIKEILEPLVKADLYTSTGVDWALRIHHDVTEPTCPTATITPELRHSCRYRYDADTIEEAVIGTVAMAYQELVQKIPLTRQAFPVTDFSVPFGADGLPNWQEFVDKRHEAEAADKALKEEIAKAYAEGGDKWIDDLSKPIDTAN